MKKLLSILGAVSMISTAPSMVVSCGGSADKKATIVSLDKLDIQIVPDTLEKDATSQIEKAISTISAKAKITTDYTIKPEEGAFDKDGKAVLGKTITVTAVAKSKYLKDSKVIKIADKVVKKDISKTALKVTSGDKKTDTETAITSAITTLEPKAKITTDFTITDKDAFDADGKAIAGKTITVAATKDSALLIGTFTITVSEKVTDITGLKPTIWAGQSQTAVEQFISDTITKYSPKAKITTDYTITYEEGTFNDKKLAEEGKTITVAAIKDSKLLKGSFTTKIVTKKSIKQKKPTTPVVPIISDSKPIQRVA